jgi:hypothetical protein
MFHFSKSLLSPTLPAAFYVALPRGWGRHGIEEFAMAPSIVRNLRRARRSRPTKGV